MAGPSSGPSAATTWPRRPRSSSCPREARPIDRIAGLEDGADDYLPKPFSPAELVLRVKSILRRDGAGRAARAALPAEPAPRQAVIRHADLTVDPDRHEVRRDDGAVIDLTRVEFRLLQAILGADGRVLSRDQLLDAVYGQEADEVMDRTIDVHIRRLRDKLDDDPERRATSRRSAASATEPAREPAS